MTLAASVLLSALLSCARLSQAACIHEYRANGIPLTCDSLWESTQTVICASVEQTHGWDCAGCDCPGDQTHSSTTTASQTLTAYNPVLLTHSILLRSDGAREDVESLVLSALDFVLDEATKNLAPEAFEFVHEGHCAAGWIGANTHQDSLEACHSQCRATSSCGYFAYDEGSLTCALYTEAGRCPDDDRFHEYNAYRLLFSRACADGLELVPVPSGECPSNIFFEIPPSCDAVGPGELCAGNGECGTTEDLNNCDNYLLLLQPQYLQPSASIRQLDIFRKSQVRTCAADSGCPRGHACSAVSGTCAPDVGYGKHIATATSAVDLGSITGEAFPALLERFGLERGGAPNATSLLDGLHELAPLTVWRVDAEVVARNFIVQEVLQDALAGLRVGASADYANFQRRIQEQSTGTGLVIGDFLFSGPLTRTLMAMSTETKTSTETHTSKDTMTTFPTATVTTTTTTTSTSTSTSTTTTTVMATTATSTTTTTTTEAQTPIGKQTATEAQTTTWTPTTAFAAATTSATTGAVVALIVVSIAVAARFRQKKATRPAGRGEEPDAEGAAATCQGAVGTFGSMRENDVIEV